MPRASKVTINSQVGFAGSAPSDAAIQTTRRRVNDLFLRGMLEAFAKYGERALKDSAQQQPASFVKAFCLLMPKEYKIEHTSPTAVLSDEQLSAMIQELEARVAERIAKGEGAKVIEGTAVPALPSPTAKPKKSNLDRLAGQSRGGWSAEKRAAAAERAKAAWAKRRKVSPTLPSAKLETASD